MKRKQRSQTFSGPVQGADQAPRCLLDQQAPSRSNGVGAIPFTQSETTRSSKELTELDDLVHGRVQTLGANLQATRGDGVANCPRGPARQPEPSDPDGG